MRNGDVANFSNSPEKNYDTISRRALPLTYFHVASLVSMAEDQELQADPWVDRSLSVV